MSREIIFGSNIIFYNNYIDSLNIESFSSSKIVSLVFKKRVQFQHLHHKIISSIFYICETTIGNLPNKDMESGWTTVINIIVNYVLFV